MTTKTPATLVTEFAQTYDERRKVGELAGSEVFYELALKAQHIYETSSGTTKTAAYLLVKIFLDLERRDTDVPVEPSVAIARFEALDEPIMGMLAVLTGQASNSDAIERMNALVEAHSAMRSV